MKKSTWIWIIIFIVGSAVRSTHMLQPVDTDSWREADVATIARNFYKNGTNIFHPQIAYDGNGPGYVESEFQLYSYLIATSYKIFGFWEPSGRVISFLISLATILVFFKFSRFLLEPTAAIVASSFFALSPLLMMISIAIQPEPLMFFFYVCSGYTFVRWLNGDSKKYYWMAILFTALALLCKITAANIGIFFLILIIKKKGWAFLVKPKVLILGALSTVPAIFWYSYCHRFYLDYGNSLGISNENALIGWDFFTKRKLITGLIQNELVNVWTLPGPLIIILALIFTKLIKKESCVLALWWLASAMMFYIIASRTTGESWAWYYHIFSVPSASILLGCSVVELYNNYFPKLPSANRTALGRATLIKSGLISVFLVLSVSFFFLFSFLYLVNTKSSFYQTSKFYICKERLDQIIPKNSLILTNGEHGKDEFGNPMAYQIAYFFYWLDRKGFSIKFEDLSVKNILAFKRAGADYFVAEKDKIMHSPGLEGELKKNFKPIFECNGCILFKL
jgi:4-amino-4-deoxy-L-arabinose transferase-like glycosyltransferase